MEFQKILDLFDTTSDDKDLPRFVTKNGLKFMINQKKIITLTKKSELKHLCWDQIYLISEIHIVLKGIIAITNPNNAKKQKKTKTKQTKQKKNKSVAFKNNAPFISCISKVNGIQIDNTEDCIGCCNANVKYAWIPQK